MKRIAIIGCGGSGKSLLACQLGTLLSLPVYDLDRLFFGEGHDFSSTSEQMEIQSRLIQENRWIIEGDYIRLQDERFASADTIIFLDFPTCIRVWRLIKRCLKNHGKRRILIRHECNHRSRWSTLKWVLFYQRKHRPIILEKLMEYNAICHIVVLRHPTEVDKYTLSIQNH